MSTSVPGRIARMSNLRPVRGGTGAGDAGDTAADSRRPVPVPMIVVTQPPAVIGSAWLADSKVPVPTRSEGKVPSGPRLTGGSPPGYPRSCYVDSQTAIFRTRDIPARRRSCPVDGLVVEPCVVRGRRRSHLRHPDRTLDRPGHFASDESRKLGLTRCHSELCPACRNDGSRPAPGPGGQTSGRCHPADV